MNYAKAIRLIRSYKGFTQKEFSKLTGFDPSYISRIEKGERVPSVNSLKLIADKLNISQYLITILASEQKDLPYDKEKDINKIARLLLDSLIINE